MHQILLEFGPIKIYSYGLALVTAFYVDYFILYRELKRLNYDPQLAMEIIFWGAVGGILGSKIYYLIENISAVITDSIGAIFSGVIGVGFYPLLGSRVWCRFGCPLAAILGISISFFDQYARTLPFEVSLFSLGLIVFGFVGSIYYSHKKGQFERQLLELQFAVKCPSCKNPIPDGNFVFCPFCGASITKKPKCSKCGKSLPEGNFLFCPFCSAPLSRQKQPSPSP